MPRPSTHHAANKAAPLDAKPSSMRPAASTRLEMASTPRPPQRSMARPAYGPASAITTSATEKAPNTVDVARPRSRATGAARMAMRYVEEAHAMVCVKPSARTSLSAPPRQPGSSGVLARCELAERFTNPAALLEQIVEVDIACGNR